MEGSQHKCEFGGIGSEYVSTDGLLLHFHVIAYPAANHVDKRVEDNENPDDAEHIEDQMCQGSSPGLRVG